MIPAANALFSTLLRGIPFWYDFTLDYMRHILVPHPWGRPLAVQIGSPADLSLNRMTILLNRLQNRPHTDHFRFNVPYPS